MSLFSSFHFAQLILPYRVVVGNLGAQKAKRNDTPISAKKDIMGDKTVRVRADLHHIIKIETAKNGGNVKEVMDKALEEYIRKYLPDKL